jgi:hypothetical protein
VISLCHTSTDPESLLSLEEKLMKMPQLFKTNHTQPRCCHKTKDGSDCKATPQTGKQYCFFHNEDPEAQQKRAEARRTGGAIRQAQAASQRPHFSVKTPQNPSEVIALVGELMDRVGQGSLDTRTANCIGHMSNIALGAMKFNFRIECEERKTAHAGAPAAVSGKQPRYTNTRLQITSIATGESRVIVPNPDGKTSTTTIIHPGRPAPCPQNDVPGAADLRATLSPESIESKKPESVEAAKTTSFEPPQSRLSSENNPKTNGHSVGLAADLSGRPLPAAESSQRTPNPAAPAPQPVSTKQTGIRNEVEVKDGIKVKNETKNEVRSEARNEEKNQVRQDQGFTGVPGLLPRHLNYLNYPNLCGRPFQKKQRLTHYDVTGMCPRRAEMMLEEARNRRRR